MEISIHNQVLLGAFLVAVVMGAVVSRTNFCTMGAVSDWTNIGDTGRMRAWVLAMAVALRSLRASSSASSSGRSRRGGFASSGLSTLRISATTPSVAC